MPLICDLFVQCGFNVPNSSRLKTNLTKGKERAFVNSKGKTATIEFIPAVFQSREKEYAVLWEDMSLILDEELSEDELNETINYFTDRKAANGYYYGNLGLTLFGSSIDGYDLMLKTD